MLSTQALLSAMAEQSPDGGRWGRGRRLFAFSVCSSGWWASARALWVRRASGALRLGHGGLASFRPRHRAAHALFPPHLRTSCSPPYSRTPDSLMGYDGRPARDVSAGRRAGTRLWQPPATPLNEFRRSRTAPAEFHACGAWRPLMSRKAHVPAPAVGAANSVHGSADGATAGAGDWSDPGIGSTRHSSGLNTGCTLRARDHRHGHYLPCSSGLGGPRNQWDLTANAEGLHMAAQGTWLL